MGTEVEPGHRGRSQGPGGRHHGVGGAGQGEDGAVVVGVAVEVEQGRPGAGGQLGQDAVVAALADVDHALEYQGHSNITGTR